MERKSKRRLPVRFIKETEPTPLKIVIVYDVFTDMIRFSEMWSNSFAHILPETEFHCSAWNFSMLRDPILRESAARRAAQADLIVFSASGQIELPEHMKNWIQTWLPEKSTRRDALVAISDEPLSASENQPRLRDFLQKTSEAGGMDFFYKADFRPTQEVGA